MPKNFFESRRDALNLNRTEMAAKVGTTAETIRTWEKELSYPARVPILHLSKCYAVSESTMSDEVMSLRRRIEARESKVAAAAK